MLIQSRKLHHLALLISDKKNKPEKIIENKGENSRNGLKQTVVQWH